MRRDPSDQGTKVKRFLLYLYKNNTSAQQNFKMGGCSTLANNVVPNLDEVTLCKDVKAEKENTFIVFNSSSLTCLLWNKKNKKISDRLVILIIHLLSLRLRFRVCHQVLDFMLLRRVKYTMVLRNISRFNSIAIQDFVCLI